MSSTRSLYLIQAQQQLDREVRQSLLPVGQLAQAQPYQQQQNGPATATMPEPRVADNQTLPPASLMQSLATAAQQQAAGQQAATQPAGQTQSAAAAASTQQNGQAQQNGGAAGGQTQTVEDRVAGAVARELGGIVQQLQQGQQGLQNELHNVLQPQQQQGGGAPFGAPGIRRGENSMNSRGYEFARVMQCLSGMRPWNQALVEVDMYRKLRDVYGPSLGQTDATPSHQSFLVPLAADHIQGFDSGFAQEVRELTLAGRMRVDPGELRQTAMAIDAAGHRLGGRFHDGIMAGVRQSASIYDDQYLGVFVNHQDAGEIISLLRAQEIFSAAGAREITLPTNGRLTMNRHTGATTGYWVGKGRVGMTNRNITASVPQTGNLLLTAKKCAALVTLPNDLIRMGTPSVEQFVRADIADTLALTVDQAFYSGEGDALEPRGLSTYSLSTHVASVVGNDGNTFQPEDVEKMVATIEENNVRGGEVVFVARPLMAANALTRRADAVTANDGMGPFVFLDMAWNAFRAQGRSTMGGYRLVRSTIVPNNRTKGVATNLTQILAGIFREWLIARHGVLEFAMTNSNGTDFEADCTTMRAIMYVDGAPRRPEAFCLCDTLVVG